MKIIEHQIPESKKKEFNTFANKFSKDPYNDEHFYLKIMEGKIEEIFPKDLQETLKSMGKTGVPSIIHIKGMPIDEFVPSAESVEERSLQKKDVSEKLIIGTVALMGYKLQSNPKEQGGNHIHNIAPVRGFENTKSSKGRDPFYLHTENPFEQNPPDFLILLGLEPDPEAKTIYFFVDDFIESFPPEIIEAMKKPNFEIRSGAGFDEVEKGTFSLITTEEYGRLRIRLYQNMERIKPLTKDAELALKYISQRFEKVENDNEIEGISIQRGEAIIFNNGWGLEKIKGVMHGRGGFIQNPNRWLQRGFLKEQQIEDIEDIADGHYRAISYVINQKQFNVKEASSILRKAMLESKDTQEYLRDNPESSVEKAFLHISTKHISSDKEPWLKRISREFTTKNYKCNILSV
jgi:hypothetical protein